MTTVSQEAREAFANWEPMFSVWPVRDSAHSVSIAKAAFLAGFEAHRQSAERREVQLPRLDDGLIEAALLAHYGKDNLGIEGTDLTANGYNWTFRQGFKRMWAGVRKELKRRAALGEKP